MSASPTPEKRDFRALQREFTDHVRDPAAAPAPAGIEDRRMGVYRDLLYRNVEGFLANSYPVLRRIHDDARWHELMRDYFRSHRARTPLFPKMPVEFLHYLEEERGERPGDFPFLRELAHYEWMEIELSLDPEELGPARAPHPDPLAAVPHLQPLARPLAYRYPVHRIGPDYLPAEPPPQPTWLLLFRDREDKVRFMELNAVSARLVELIARGQGRPGRALLEQIAAELGHGDPAAVLRGGTAILEEMQAKEIVFLQ